MATKTGRLLQAKISTKLFIQSVNMANERCNHWINLRICHKMLLFTLASYQSLLAEIEDLDKVHGFSTAQLANLRCLYENKKPP